MRAPFVTALLAVVAVAGWWMAWSARTELNDAKGRLASAQASARSAGRERDQWKARLQSMEDELAAAKTPAVTAAIAKQPVPVVRPQVFPEAQPDYFRRVVEDPEVNALFVAQQNLQLRGKYAVLLKMLRLTPAEEQAFIKRLVEKRVTAMDVANVAQANGLKPNGDAVLKGFDQANADSDQAIRTLLGDDRFAQYQSFDKNLPQWNLIYGVSRDIAVASSPLDGAQSETLMKIMAQAPELWRPGDNRGPADLDTDAATYAEWTQAALKQASSVLTPEQLSVLGNYFEGARLSLKMKAALQHPDPTAR